MPFLPLLVNFNPSLRRAPTGRRLCGEICRLPRRKRQLRGEGCRSRVPGAGEDGTEPIARCFEDAAAAALDDAPQQGIVADEGMAHGLRVFFPEAGAALDIREQESNG